MISAAVPGAKAGSGPHARAAAAVSSPGCVATDRVSPASTAPYRPAAGPADDTEGAPEQPARTMAASRHAPSNRASVPAPRRGASATSLPRPALRSGLLPDPSITTLAAASRIINRVRGQAYRAQPFDQRQARLQVRSGFEHDLAGVLASQDPAVGCRCFGEGVGPVNERFDLAQVPEGEN